MPITLDKQLAAIDVLRQENIFVSWTRKEPGPRTSGL